MDVAFYGLLDFVGYPVWGPQPSAPTGGAKFGAGQIWAMVLQEEERRRNLEGIDRDIFRTILQKIEDRYGEYERQRREMIGNMQTTVLLAEV